MCLIVCLAHPSFHINKIDELEALINARYWRSRMEVMRNFDQDNFLHRYANLQISGASSLFLTNAQLDLGSIWWASQEV